MNVKAGSGATPEPAPSCAPPADRVRRKDAERFVEEVRGDDPAVAAKLRIEERELEAGGRLARWLPTGRAIVWASRKTL